MDFSNLPNPQAALYNLGARPRDNILHNSRWDRPEAIINQKGQTEYAGAGYTIDRWKLYGSGIRCVLNDNYLSIAATADNNSIGQTIESERILFEQVTFSCLRSDGTLVSGTGKIPSTATDYYSVTLCSDQTMSLYIQYLSGKMLALIGVKNNNTVNVVAAKLELGPVQTLARQDASGNWVLNDPPPDPALELAKCQRYQMVYNCPASGYGHIAYMMKAIEGTWYGFLHLPSSLRIWPTIKVTGGEPILNIFNAIHNVSDWGVLSLTGNHALIYVSSPADVPKGTWAMLQTTNSPAQLILDSNL